MLAGIEKRQELISAYQSLGAWALPGMIAEELARGTTDPLLAWERIAPDCISAGLCVQQQALVSHWLKAIDLTSRCRDDIEPRFAGLQTWMFDVPNSEQRLHVYVGIDSDQTARAAATFIGSFVLKEQEPYITFATGATQELVYERLAEDREYRGIDFSRVCATHLDEYHICGPDELHSFQKFIRERVVGPLGINDFRGIDGRAPDVMQETTRLEDMHQQWHQDRKAGLTILGIGPSADPHLAFVHKRTPWSTGYHHTDLDPETIQRDVDRGQPLQPYAITAGISTIFRTPLVMLVGYGADKGISLRKSLRCPIDATYKAAALALFPGRTTLFLDQRAAEALFE